MVKLLLIGVLFLNLNAKSEHTYSKTTVVAEVNRTTDTVTCIDFNGDKWCFKGCEDWEQGDIASLLMSDNKTKNIYDDIILNARYEGYFE